MTENLKLVKRKIITIDEYEPVAGSDPVDPVDPVDPEPVDPPYQLVDLNENAAGDLVFPVEDRVKVELGTGFILKAGKRGDYNIQYADMPAYEDMGMLLTLNDTFGAGLQITLCLFSEKLPLADRKAQLAGVPCMALNISTADNVSRFHNPGTYEFNPLQRLLDGVDLSAGDEMTMSNYLMDDLDRIAIHKYGELNTIKAEFYCIPREDSGKYLVKP